MKFELKQKNNIVHSDHEIVIAKMRDADIGKMQEIATDGLYKNIFETSIQEIISNAIDITKKVKKTTDTIIIKLPTDILNPELCVRDFGTGLTKDELVSSLQMFYSNKSGEMSMGRYGLGMKIYLAIQKFFTINSYKNGTKTTYLISRNEKNETCIATLNSTKTSEDNGIEVIFQIKKEHMSLLMKAINRCIFFHEKRPSIVFSDIFNDDYQLSNCSDHIVLINEKDYIVPFYNQDNFCLGSVNNQRLVGLETKYGVILNGIPYPFSKDDPYYKLMKELTNDNYPLYLKFDKDEIQPMPNRETISSKLDENGNLVYHNLIMKKINFFKNEILQKLRNSFTDQYSNYNSIVKLFNQTFISQNTPTKNGIVFQQYKPNLVFTYQKTSFSSQAFVLKTGFNESLNVTYESLTNKKRKLVDKILTVNSMASLVIAINLNGEENDYSNHQLIKRFLKFHYKNFNIIYHIFNKLPENDILNVFVKTFNLDEIKKWTIEQKKSKKKIGKNQLMHSLFWEGETYFFNTLKQKENFLQSKNPFFRAQKVLFKNSGSFANLKIFFDDCKTTKDSIKEYLFVCNSKTTWNVPKHKRDLFNLENISQISTLFPEFNVVLMTKNNLEQLKKRYPKITIMTPEILNDRIDTLIDFFSKNDWLKMVYAYENSTFFDIKSFNHLLPKKCLVKLQRKYYSYPFFNNQSDKINNCIYLLVNDFGLNFQLNKNTKNSKLHYLFNTLLAQYEFGHQKKNFADNNLILFENFFIT